MILTCPECSSRYEIAEQSIGATGRKVRCASCGHVWKQYPIETEDTPFDENMFGDHIVFPHERETKTPAAPDMMPGAIPAPEPAHENPSAFESVLRQEMAADTIPQGVRPLAEDDPVLAQLGARPSEVKNGYRAAKVAGFLTAALILLSVLGVLFAFHETIARAWPPSNLIYRLAGFENVLPVEGLALDSLSVEMKGSVTVFKGTVLNLKSVDLDMPPILATLKDKNGLAIDQVLIPPPVSRLKGEGQATFELAYQKPLTVKGVPASADFAFSVMPEKGAHR